MSERSEGQKLILEALGKAVDDARSRVQGIGMSNMIGMDAADRALANVAYAKACDDLVKAQAALDEYVRQISK